MEVTRKNFRAVLPLLFDAVKDCDFIAIDGEFTGLSTLRQNRSSYDTVAEKYSKIRKGSQNFLLLQYGICCFSWDKVQKQYLARPFTCYLFPRPYKRYHNDVFFTCQSSSLDFLAGHNFDFNKVFYDGISYMAPWEEQHALDKLGHQLSFFETPVTTVNNSLPVKDVFIPKNQREFVDSVCLKVAEFMRDNAKDRFDLEPCNAFQRKLLYETLEQKYPLGLYLESALDDISKQKIIRCVKVTETARGKLNEEKRKEEMAELDEVVGFTKVMRFISDSKKLILGHNMVLDLVLTLGQFFARLPEDLDEFKSLARTVFPRLLDTKLMASTQPLREKIYSSSLSGLMALVDEQVLPKASVVFAENFSMFEDGGGNFHNAGYDAFCTGSSFISMAKYLLTGLNIHGDHVDIDSKILSSFVNKIYLMGIQDIQYMDLNRVDVTPCRKHIFFVKFPRGWTEHDLESLFDPICPILRPFVWLGETSVFVTLSRPEKREEVMEHLVRGASVPGVFIQPFGGVTAPSQPSRAEPLQKTPGELTVRKRRSEDSPASGKKAKQMAGSGVNFEDGERVDFEDGELADDAMESAPGCEDEGELPDACSEITSATEKTVSNKIFFEPADW